MPALSSAGFAGVQTLIGLLTLSLRTQDRPGYELSVDIIASFDRTFPSITLESAIAITKIGYAEGGASFEGGGRRQLCHHTYCSSMSATLRLLIT